MWLWRLRRERRADAAVRRAVDVLVKPASYFIHPGAPLLRRRTARRCSIANVSRAQHCADDHAALGALCGDAVAHVTSREATRLRRRTTAAGGFVAMDCRACFDGEFLYVTMLDASEATRVEDSLRESLSTSAPPQRYLRTGEAAS